MSARSTTFHSLGVRNFKLFFVGQVISQAGTWMQTIALGWLVLDLSNENGLAVGFAVALQFLPTLLFGVWAGMLADRFDKRRIMINTQAALAMVAVVLAVLDFTGIVELWMLFVIVFLYGVAFSIDNPTRQSMVPELVGPSDLPNAIGLSSASLQVARIVGPAVAGVLIVAVGTGMCFAVNAVSYIFVIAALVAIRPREMHRHAPAAPAPGQIRDGLRYMWRTPELRSILLVLIMVGTFAINSPVILPLLARVTFHGDADVYSWMTMAMGAGALVGALIWASRPAARPNVAVITGLVFGIGALAASLAPSLGAFLAFVAIMGAGQTTFVATCNSLLQLVSEPVMRGRVMAVYTIALLGTTPIGGPIIGWLAEQLGPRWAYGLGAVVTITSVLALRIAFARVHRLGGLRPRAAEFGAADEIVLGVDGEVIPASIR